MTALGGKTPGYPAGEWGRASGRLAAVLAAAGATAFLRDTATLTVGALLSQLASLAFLPLFSRLYTPSEFGVAAVFSAVAGIVGTLLTLRYEVSIVVPKDEAVARLLLKLCLALILVLGVPLTAVSGLLPYRLSSLLGLASLGRFLPLAVVTGMFVSVFTTVTNWLNRARDYRGISLARILAATLIGFSTLVLGSLDVSSGLMVSQALGQFAVALYLLYRCRRVLTAWPRAELFEVLRLHAANPKYLLPTALLDVFTQQLPLLLVTYWFSSAVAGQFSMAWRITAIPLALIGGAVGQVFYQRLSSVWPEQDEARSLLLATWKTLLVLGALPTLLLMLFGRPLFAWFFGPVWGEAGEVASILAPMFLAMFVSSPTSGMYIVFGLHRYMTLFGAALFLYRAGCLYYGCATNNLKAGLWAWVICEIAGILAYNYLGWTRLRKR